MKGLKEFQLNHAPLICSQYYVCLYGTHLAGQLLVVRLGRTVQMRHIQLGNKLVIFNESLKEASWKQLREERRLSFVVSSDDTEDKFIFQ